jgi:hypothetical protein
MPHAAGVRHRLTVFLALLADWPIGITASLPTRRYRRRVERLAVHAA